MKKTSITKVGTAVKKASGTIKWTNKYDCPPGYVFNNEGFVITEDYHSKVWVNTLPHLWGLYTPSGLLYNNLLALYYLNPDKPFSTLLAAAKNKISKALMYTHSLEEEDIQRAVEMYEEFEGDVTEELTSDFHKKDTIWYSEWCDIQNTQAIKFKITMDYIDAMRSVMAINKKFKTKEVSKETNQPSHTIYRYWKKKGMPAPTRVLDAISEAYVELSDQGVDVPSQQQLADVSGVSLRTVQRLKSQGKLIEYDKPSKSKEK
jgi:hypothetical protein